MRGLSGGQCWARLRQSLWQPPRPHGEQPPERSVGPLELFYDLAVVVLVAQAEIYRTSRWRLSPAHAARRGTGGRPKLRCGRPGPGGG